MDRTLDGHGLGLHAAANFYYYPARHEPGGALALGINTRVWESFDEGDQKLIEVAAARAPAVSGALIGGKFAWSRVESVRMAASRANIAR